ncbi:MAG: hydroxyectoine utilization dehydratase EutB [Trueperaceae bacterium]|nr:hydroxyectoine utilization dehydratase EutB [Trueperaceae bacterium]
MTISPNYFTFNMPTLRDIYLARQRIAGIIRHTPLLPSPKLSTPDYEVFLKLDSLQDTGAFKLRGASNKILSLSDEERARGVVTVSTGNHGRAVAYVAQKLGIRAVVCLSHDVPQNKVAAIRALGAELEIVGRSQDDAEVRAKELRDDEGLTWVPPFDDPAVIAGQGTLGLELLIDLPDIDTALIPLSGGGLFGGVALALKSADPNIRTIGVSMERAPVMVKSLEAGEPVELPEQDTLADSLRGGIGLDNRYTFALARRYLDDTVLLSEDDIGAGMAFAFYEHGVVLEGAGAVGIAALLRGKVANVGRRVAVLACGRNVDPNRFLAVLAQHPPETFS